MPHFTQLCSAYSVLYAVLTTDGSHDIASRMQHHVPMTDSVEDLTTFTVKTQNPSAASKVLNW